MTGASREATRKTGRGAHGSENDGGEPQGCEKTEGRGPYCCVNGEEAGCAIEDRLPNRKENEPLLRFHRRESRNAIRGSRVRNGAEVLLSLDDIHTQFGEFLNE